MAPTPARMGVGARASCAALLVVLAAGWVGPHTAVASEAPAVVQVALLGATGDLASKYLWQSLFALWSEADAGSLDVLAAARRPADEVRPLVRTILADRVSCASLPPNPAFATCEDAKAAFLDSLAFAHISDDASYAAIGSTFDSRLASRGAGVTLAGRLFHLAISPSAVPAAAAGLHAHAHAARSAHATPASWTRLLLEKPVGSSGASAAALLSSLTQSWAPSELFVVDHYLGKSAVASIGALRRTMGKTALDLWHWNRLRFVEVVMEETEDVEGRTSLYDELGIFRDVFQNHLTELAALALAPMPELAPEAAASSATATGANANADATATATANATEAGANATTPVAEDAIVDGEGKLAEAAQWSSNAAGSDAQAVEGGEGGAEVEQEGDGEVAASTSASSASASPSSSSSSSSEEGAGWRLRSGAVPASSLDPAAFPTNAHRAAFLRVLRPAKGMGTKKLALWQGQYTGYGASNTSEVAARIDAASDAAPASFRRTATAGRASVVVGEGDEELSLLRPTLESLPEHGYPSLLGVPVVMVAGKQLAHRRAFVRMQFGPLGRLTWLLHGAVPLALTEEDLRALTATTSSLLPPYEFPAELEAALRPNLTAEEVREQHGVSLVRLDGPAIIYERPIHYNQQLPALEGVPANYKVIIGADDPKATLVVAVPRSDYEWTDGSSATSSAQRATAAWWMRVGRRHSVRTTSADAYTTLLAAAIEGNRVPFVDTTEVAALWRLWDPMLEKVEGREAEQEDEARKPGLPLRLYNRGEIRWLGLGATAGWVRVDDPHGAMSVRSNLVEGEGVMPPGLRDAVATLNHNKAKKKEVFAGFALPPCILPDGSVGKCPQLYVT